MNELRKSMDEMYGCNDPFALRALQKLRSAIFKPGSQKHQQKILGKDIFKKTAV